MHPYVVLDHLGYEAIQCPTAGSNLLQDRSAARVLLEGTLDRLELAADSTDSAKTFLLLFFVASVRHLSLKLSSWMVYIPL
jgi:hypothetical protein